MFILLLDRNQSQLPKIKSSDKITKQEECSHLTNVHQLSLIHICKSPHLTSSQSSSKVLSLFKGIFVPKRETIVENDARRSFYISCEKPIPSLLPIQYLAALFHLCRTFCANLLLSIVFNFLPKK